MQQERRPIAVRAYVTSTKTATQALPKLRQENTPALGWSEWSLTFDTETTTDAAQQLRFGVYQIRKAGILHAQGLFYEPLTLTDADRSTLYAFAAEHDLEVRTVTEFIEEVFSLYVYELRGLCLGFNLPFDLSRIAIDHASARGSMRGGFSFQLRADKYRPRVQVKHLTGRAALIQFTKPRRQDTPRGMRKRKLTVPPRRGYFLDVRTTAGAMLSGSWSLATLSHHLDTPHKKDESDEHGGPLTPEYLAYAMNDVQVTWECFEHLNEQYADYDMSRTLITRIYSEASLGKAGLKEMGIGPWRDLQPDMPPEPLGIMMSTYKGGRSEVHLRRVISRVLYCDFLSMYPTVCVLMDLWRFVIAERITWRDATAEVQTLLDTITVDDLQRPETWRRLPVLVEVEPDADIFPVRAKYEEDGQYTIGLNHLTSEQPLWFTLADCIASTLLTGKSPRVRRAIRFSPVGVQDGLQSIDLFGNPEYRVDPLHENFHRRLIDLRSAIRAEQKAARLAGDLARADVLDTVQHAIKILANATSYGIYVELNVDEQDTLQEVICYGHDGEPFSTFVRNVEEPGRYFHPLLGTLITGAARLMLALAERLAIDEGITWAFCDTDSMALAKPEGIPDDEFLVCAERVRDWFTPLNPYEHKGPVFKIEDANYRLDGGKLTDDLEPLYAFAVSAKRYVLFNLDQQGRPVLRKASGHGLGHLRPPYTEKNAPRQIPKPVVSQKDLGVERWQHDVWYRIVQAALNGHPEQVRLDDLPGFDAPAVSRYAATTPELLRWYTSYNTARTYREQVRPFGFLLAFQADPQSLPLDEVVALPRPVSPFDTDPVAASEMCFDRVTGQPVASIALKTYRQALAQYHLHPESKFLNADFVDHGETLRRYIYAEAIEHIGKEANRWEEQLYLGLDPEAQIVYGLSPEGRKRMYGDVLRAGQQFGQRRLAKASDVSLSEVSAILQGKRRPRRETLATLWHAAVALEQAEQEREAEARDVIEAVRERCQEIGLREVARRTGVDAANLSKVLSGCRKLSNAMLKSLIRVVDP